MTACISGRCEREAAEGSEYCCDPCRFVWERAFRETTMHSGRCNAVAGRQGWDDRAHARTTDPETSHAAARKVKVSKGRQEVLDALKAIGPTTSDRVADYLGKNLTVVSPRFRPMVRLGLIRDTGRKMPTTVGGQDAIVWEAVDP